MAVPILEVCELNTQLVIHNQPVSVVDKLSFCLYPGKTLALVGESGCGKSMTALSLMRILPTPPALPSKGQVLYKGKNLLTLSEGAMRQIRGGKIAMIFQDPASALNPVYSIGTQLMEVVEMHLGLYGEEAWEKCIKALQEVHIASPEERLLEYPHQMSGGMRQRIMIAMALLCEPDILIADEPTTALDVTIQAQVLDLIRELQVKKGMSLLLITHDMGVVAEMAHEVVVMYAAQAVEKGSVDEIFDQMAHPYTKGLFQSRTSLNKGKGPLPTIKGSVPSPLHYPKGCRFYPRCPFAMPCCNEQPIPFFPVSQEPNDPHIARCVLYDPDIAALEKKQND